MPISSPNNTKACDKLQWSDLPLTGDSLPLDQTVLLCVSINPLSKSEIDRSESLENPAKTIRFFLVLAGTLKIETQLESLFLVSGDSFSHGMNQRPTKTQFSDDILLLSLSFSIQDNKINPLACEKLFFSRSNARKSSFRMLFDRFCASLKQHEERSDPFRLHLISSYLTIIVSEHFDLLYRCEKADHQMSHTARSQQNALSKAQRYIENNYMDADINAEDIATHVDLTSRHLTRLFKSHLASTPKKALQDYRLKQAEQILQNEPAARIKEVAYRCGFKEPSYFAQRFKKHTGSSPSDMSYSQ